MRVIPVIDLKGGVAVHAVRGERERYRPVRSRIAAGSDPVELTRSVRDGFGLDEVYVADLDAIAGGAGNREVVAAVAAEARAMVDAGTSSAGAVARVLDLARVGSGEGPDVALLADLHARLPDVDLLAGGGVRDASDLRALAEAGAAGALVATALHGGAIAAGEVRALV